MCKISERREAILAIIENGLVTADACAKKVKASTRTVYRDIDALRKEGAPIIGESGMGYVLRQRRSNHVNG